MTDAEPMLIDRFLPRFDVTLIEHLVVDADIDATWQAVHDLDLMRVHTPLMDAAMFVRGAPATVARWFGKGKPVEPPRELKVFAAGAELPGWLFLGERARREVLLGAIGRFWRPNIEWYDVTDLTPEQFAAFTEPGWGRIAAGISLHPYGAARTLVSYEARTATADAASARQFSRYWRLVRPFVGVVMRATLAAVRGEVAALGHPEGDFRPSKT